MESIPTDPNEIQERLEHLTFSLGEAARAERASLFLVDLERCELSLEVARPERGHPLVVRMPAGQGLVGHASTSGRALWVDDAYADARFDPSVDRASGFRTRSILCVPVWDRRGRVTAVVELLNPIGRPRFGVVDAARVRAREAELAALLEARRAA